MRLMSVNDHKNLRKGTREALSLVIAFYKARQQTTPKFNPKNDNLRFMEFARFVYNEEELGPMDFDHKKEKLRYAFGRLYERGIMHRVQCQKDRKQHIYTSNYDLRQLKTILANNPA